VRWLPVSQQASACSGRSGTKYDAIKMHCQLCPDRCKTDLTHLPSVFWVPLLPRNDFQAIGLGDQSLDPMQGAGHPNLLQGISKDLTPSAPGLRQVEIRGFESIQRLDGLHLVTQDIVLLPVCLPHTTLGSWLAFVSSVAMCFKP
jgi:hypothetical protein